MRCRWSLRSLLVGMAILGVLFSLVGSWWMRVTRQKAAVSSIVPVGEVSFDAWGASMLVELPDDPPQDGAIVTWLRKQFGDEYFGSVRTIMITRPLKEQQKSAFVQLPLLRDCIFAKMPVTATDLRYLSASQSVDSIAFRKCLLPPQVLNELSAFPQMRALTFTSFDIESRHLQAIDWKNLPSLTSLKLSFTSVDSLEFLRDVQTLRHLQIKECKIEDDSLRYIGEHQSLESLVLNSTGISDGGLRYLEGMENLRFVELGALCSTTSSGVESLKQALKRCEVNGQRFGD